MNPPLPISTESLVKLLAGIDFDKRYYRLTETYREAIDTRPTGPWMDMAKTFLEASPFEFKYNKREKFFSHKDSYNGCEVGLNIAFPYSVVELILVLKVGGEHLGGPFTLLARKAGQWRDPAFAPSPAAPKIPFGDPDQLQDILQSSLELFEDTRRVILAHLGIPLS